MSGASSQPGVITEKRKAGSLSASKSNAFSLFRFQLGALELPVLGSDVHALQGAQKLVVAQSQVLEAWWRVSTQTLHAGDDVAVELQHLQGRKGHL